MFESWPEMWGGGYPAYRTTLRKFLWFRTVTGGNAPEFKTVTGRIVSFLTKRIAPLKIEAALEPIQDLHGYDNPWPGGGGDNKLDFAAAFTEGETIEQNGITAKFSNGYLKVTGTNTSGAVFNIVYKSISATLGGGTYTLPTRITIRCAIDGGSNANKAGTITAETSIATVAWYIEIPTTATNIDWNIPLMLVSGSTAPTTYSPYSNECPISGHSGADIYVEDEYDAQADPTVQITFGSTVYGCKLTVNEDGTGTVTGKYAEVDMGTLTWGRETVGTYPYFYVSNVYSAARPERISVLCSMYKGIVNQKGTNFRARDNNGCICINTQSIYPTILVQDSAYTDAAAFKTAMSGVQLVYELATPITITLSPGQVNALLGNNTVWLDTGDDTEISVTYQSN